MSLEAQARPGSLAWSNPVTRWWGFLTLVSGANIAVWFLLYRQLHEQPAGSGSLNGMSSGTGLMLLLSAAYVNLAFVAVSEKMITWFSLDSEPSIWISFVISMLLLGLILRKG